MERRMRDSSGKWVIAALVMLLLALSTVTASATVLYGTGQGLNPDLAPPDPHWNVVAVPAAYTPTSPTPYAAIVGPWIHPAWYGSGSTGHDVAGNTFYNQLGYNNSYWIAPNGTSAALLGNDSSYNWIVAQTFTVPQTAVYNFNFYGAGDNELNFYIDGTISRTKGANFPDIINGTQIGGTAGGYNYITQFTGQATLAAGQHTAYMTLYDYGGFTGALIGPSTFEYSGPAPPDFNPVPEPSTYALLCISLGVVGYARKKMVKSEG